jgi:hypothetical protein
VIKGYQACIKLLVEAGADLNNALDIAIYHKQKEAGEYLHSVGAKCT